MAGAALSLPALVIAAGFAPAARAAAVSLSVPVGGNGPLTLMPEAAVKIPGNGVLFLQIDYLDKGYGNFDVRVVGDRGVSAGPDRHLGLTRSDSGKMVSARMRIPGIPAAAGDGLSVRVDLQKTKGPPLAIGNAVIQDTPFADPDFQYIISEPWNGRYTGPSVKAADNTTLAGKAMTGYQGWFRTPNDPYGESWVHWGNIPEGTFAVDMWPDISQYPPRVLQKACDVKLTSGEPAYLFSSAWPDVVNTHFRWMREHDIDGAFLQRFVNDRIHSIGGGPEWVLANVRAAANREGRIWAIEYDVSGYPDDKLLETLVRDWKWLVDDFELLADPNYAREGGKPVVFIWGLPFPDRHFSPATADAVVHFFKNDPKYGGNHVIGGIPNNFRGMSAAWQNHIANYHCVLPWMSGSFQEDLRDISKLGLGFYAHVKPGFSWANLKHLPTGDDTLQYTPRDEGRYYWKQLGEAAAAGVDRLFVGMFDEYDEATAIMPMSDDPPPTPVRPGVAAVFYNGANAAEHGKFLRLDRAALDMGNAPPADGIQPRNFFVRLGGRITFPKSGSYRFIVEGVPGDDVELTVDGTKFIRKNALSGVEESAGSLPVKAGETANYHVEYRHRDGIGKFRLHWEAPGLPAEPIPASALQDAWGRFLTNEGRPPDCWLKLTERGKRLMNDRARNEPEPTSGQ